MRAVGGFLALGLAALLTVGCSDSPTATPQPTNEGVNEGVGDGPQQGGTTPGAELYRSVLSGDEEVPAVETRASGSASFHLSGDGTTIVYAVTVSEITNVTDAHIHLGGRGEVGPPIVDLFDGSISGEYNGLLTQGMITASDLVGPLSGMTLAELHSLLASGGAYVNVHTAQHPAGEIRGQVVTAPEDDEGV